ncbi:BspA family leucine-rich repeat surface protein [Enterococcus mundtii]
MHNLDVSQWDTSQVTSMNGMFQNSRELKELDVSNWNTSKVTSMSLMF